MGGVGVQLGFEGEELRSDEVGIQRLTGGGSGGVEGHEWGENF